MGPLKYLKNRVGDYFVNQVGNKIVCVGRNYKKHANELGNAVPSSPLLFLKPTSSYIRPPGPILIPPAPADIHHEVELGVLIGKRLSRISRDQALAAVAGYVCAVDVTDREAQRVAKERGEPWTLAKGRDSFCPVSDLVLAKRVPDPNKVGLWLSVNGERRQEGNTSEMVFDVEELITYISGVMTLNEGDIILTGTPEGVGPLKPGDKLTAGLAGLIEMEFDCEEYDERK